MTSNSYITAYVSVSSGAGKIQTVELLKASNLRNAVNITLESQLFELQDRGITDEDIQNYYSTSGIIEEHKTGWVSSGEEDITLIIAPNTEWHRLITEVKQDNWDELTQIEFLDLCNSAYTTLAS